VAAVPIQAVARPSDVSGVEVVLTVLDPNNNVFEVGRVISDSNGDFSFMYTPEIAGRHILIASFASSKLTMHLLRKQH
jgi:hypothetical protein